MYLYRSWFLWLWSVSVYGLHDWRAGSWIFLLPEVYEHFQESAHTFQFLCRGLALEHELSNGVVDPNFEGRAVDGVTERFGGVHVLLE